MKKQNQVRLSWPMLFWFCLLLLFGTALNISAATPVIKYQTHVQNIGWQSYVTSGQTAGTSGKSLRMEGLRIKFASSTTSYVTYRVHVADVGWQSWKTSGQLAGSTGNSRAIEAVQIKLTGAYAKKYDVYYRVHIPDKGWLAWTKNGGSAGSVGLAVRTEAIQIKIRAKTSPLSTSGVAFLSKPTLTYRAHSQNIGWKPYVQEGAVAGTTGQSLRLEAMTLRFKNFYGGSGIQYRAHVADIGWMNWVSSGNIAGTTGSSRQVEAIQIRLVNGMAAYFDVYYRVHVADYGWLGWAKNGESAGTTGGKIRAEALQVKIVRKGLAFARGGASYIDASNNGIRLAHHMTQSLKQPYSGPCCAYAYGIGLSIVLGYNVNPMQFYYGGLCHYDKGHVGSYTTYNAAAIYQALKNGRPTMLHFNYSTSTYSGQHWVLINGVRNGANPNNLQYSDFTCYDSAYGDERPLTSAAHFSQGTVAGIKIFT